MDIVTLVMRKEIMLERGVVALLKIHKAFDLDCEEDLKEIHSQFDMQHSLEKTRMRNVFVGGREYSYKYIKTVKALGLHPRHMRKELDPRDVDAWIKERLIALT